MKRIIIFLISLFIWGCSSSPVDFKGLYDRIFQKDEIIHLSEQHIQQEQTVESEETNYTNDKLENENVE